MFRILIVISFTMYMLIALEAKARLREIQDDFTGPNFSWNQKWVPCENPFNQTLEEKIVTKTEISQPDSLSTQVTEKNAETDFLAAPTNLSLSHEAVAANPYHEKISFVVEGKQFLRDVVSDYKNYYGWKNGLRLTLAVGLAAPFANTDVDMDFHRWYQDDVRCDTLDDMAEFWKFFGTGKYTLPIFGGLSVVALLTTEKCGWLDTGLGEFNKNVIRAYLVGTPPMLFMQALLGGERPCNGSVQWHPFKSNHSVSGHAFMGATPFIIAAKMTDNKWLKVLFYTCSTLPAWSRVNDGAHSLSQVGLGWYMAYMACDSVCVTNNARSPIYQVTPIIAPSVVGANLTLKY